MNKRILLLGIVGTLLLLLIGTSISYSLWLVSDSQVDDNLVDMGCFNVTLTGNNDVLNLINDFPRNDNDGLDSEPYSFTIENTCTIDAAYKIKLELQSDNTLPTNLTKVALNDRISLLSGLDSEYNVYLLESDYLSAGESKDYEYKQWIDSSATLDNATNKKLSVKIVLESVATVIPPYSETLLAGSDPVLNSGFVPVVIESDGTVKKANVYEEWYNYENKEWANAVTVNSESLRNADAGTEIPMDNIEEMYVWIPRYAYDADTIVNASQAIDITFVDTETDAHPAFTVDGTELKGMWIGKFEMGFKDGESESTANVEYVVKPNLNSVHSSNVSTMFTKIANINNTNNLDETTDVHMMKNTEWGMVAYLSQSIYGVCTSATECEKTENNNYYNSSSYDIVTGCGGDDTGISTADTGVDICPVENRWTTESGMHASTTRNITGIYDMAGGRNEFVMGNMLNSSGSFFPSNSGFTTAPESKYYDVYANGSSSTDYLRGLAGDGTIELSPSSNVNTNWNDDYAYFVGYSESWFLRGSSVPDNSHAGIWYFSCNSGKVKDGNGCRVAVWSY